MEQRALNRREVLAGAAATIAATLSVPGTAEACPRSDFVAMRQHLDESLAAFRAAGARRLAAQGRILADMRASGNRARTFFDAPEVGAAAHARMRARTAAENIFFSPASNTAELAMQEEARRIFDNELT